MFLTFHIAFFYIHSILFVFCAEEKLELTHVIYRHGDRTPVRSYPLDPYKDESNWPEGFGQLTMAGKEMEYKLGTWLRKRYNQFINQTFITTEINVLSTDVDRTLMSAQCVLAAFYYPDVDERFNRTLPWMPTPIHTSPAGKDETLNVDSTCPQISKEMIKMEALPEIQGYLKEHEKLARYLSYHTGLEVNSILEMDFLYDTLFIENLYNFTLPQWTDDIMDELKRIADFSFVISAYTTSLKRLRGGPLLTQITENMLKKSHNNLTEKLFMYSAHDTTVSILLNCMKIFNNISPPYAATILVELYRIDEKFYVKTFYRNDSNIENDALLLTVPGCTAACPLTKWIEIMSYAMPENWDKECHRPNAEADVFYIQALTGLCLFLGSFTLFTIGYFIFNNCHFRRSSQKTFPSALNEKESCYTPLRNAQFIPDYSSISRDKFYYDA